MLDILHEIEQAALRKLPIPRNKTSNNISMKAIPRWKEDVAPYKDNALFWNSVWNSAGKPHNTELHNIMKRTRNLYHFHIRKNKRMLDKIKRSKLLNACLNSENGIFSEMKSMRRNKSTYPNAIDGKTDKIPAQFACKYNNLYNSINDENDLRTIKDVVCRKLVTADISEIEKVTPNLLREASKKLRPNKSDPISSILSDYFINALDIVYTHLSNIMHSYLTHGHISTVLTVSTMFPVLKDKLGNHSDSNNYRCIAVSSVILKLFDWVILFFTKTVFILVNFSSVISLIVQQLCALGKF